MRNRECALFAQPKGLTGVETHACGVAAPATFGYEQF